MMRTFKIYRFNTEEDKAPFYKTYQVDVPEGMTILDALNEIKWKQDGSLTFRRSCRHGICGSCAMTINGLNKLACETQVKSLGGGTIEIDPLRHFKVIKDLAVDMEDFFQKLEEVKPYLIVHGRGVTVYGNAARPLTHVRDAAASIVHAVELGYMAGPYNVVGENWQMQDLGRAVADATGAHLIFKPGGADARDYSASGERLRREIAWSPKRTVKATIPQLVVDSFNLGLPSRYVRLQTLKSLMSANVINQQLRSAA